MISYPRRPKSGHFTCYLNRTYHVLTTLRKWREAVEDNLCQREGDADHFWTSIPAMTENLKGDLDSLPLRRRILCAFG